MPRAKPYGESSLCSPRVNVDHQDPRVTGETTAPAAMRSVLLHHLGRRELRGKQEMLPVRAVPSPHGP